MKASLVAECVENSFDDAGDYSSDNKYLRKDKIRQ